MTTKLATAMPIRAAVLNRSLQIIRPKLMGEVSCEGTGGASGLTRRSSSNGRPLRPEITRIG